MLPPDLSETSTMTKTQSFTAVFAVILSVLLTDCSREKPDLLAPVPVTMLKWGSSQSDVETLHQNTEWVVSRKETDQLQYQIRIQADGDQSSLLKDLPNDPHTVTWFFNGDKLAIVQIIRKDSAEKLKEYRIKAEKEYNLKQPVWESGEKVFSGNQETESVIKENVSVYDSGDLIIKTVYSEIQADTIPEKMKAETKSVFADRFEIMLYSKSQNQGLTAEALADLEK